MENQILKSFCIPLGKGSGSKIRVVVVSELSKGEIIPVSETEKVEKETSQLIVEGEVKVTKPLYYDGNEIKL